MVNRVSRYFLKGGHSATKTELKINYEHSINDLQYSIELEWHQGTGIMNVILFQIRVKRLDLLRAKKIFRWAILRFQP